MSTAQPHAHQERYVTKILHSPSSFCDDHFSSEFVEFVPEIFVFQVAVNPWQFGTVAASFQVIGIGIGSRIFRVFGRIGRRRSWSGTDPISVFLTCICDDRRRRRRPRILAVVKEVVVVKLGGSRRGDRTWANVSIGRRRGLSTWCRGNGWRRSLSHECFSKTRVNCDEGKNR